MSKFNGNKSIIDQKIIFDNNPYKIINITPQNFNHRRTEVFIPLQQKLDPATRDSHFLATYARLKNGVTLERATAEMSKLKNTLAQKYGYNHKIDVHSYFEATIDNVQTPLQVLLNVVLLILLIAYTNVANLLLTSKMTH